MADQPVKPVEADDYYDKVHRTTWLRRVAGLFAGATLGAAVGAAIGTVAAFVPFVLGAMGVAGAAVVAAPTLAAVASTMTVFAGVVAVIGMAISADVGANSASIAAGLAEKEEKENGRQAPEKNTAQAVAKDSKPSSLYAWKAAPILIPMFATFGALTALNPITASALASLSFTGGAFAAHSAAAVVSSSIIFGTAGALMPLSNAIITNKLSNFFMDVFKGKVFDRIVGKSPASEAPAIAPEAVLPAVDLALDHPRSEGKSFAAAEKRFAVQPRALDKGEDCGCSGRQF